MSASRLCTSCSNTSLSRDDDTGGLFFASCGAVKSFDQYESFTGDINGPQGTFVHIETSGSGNFYSYKDRKLLSTRYSIEEFTNRLGLCSKTIEIKSMISDITDGEFDQGNWFQVLIGALLCRNAGGGSSFTYGGNC
ncbi:unnamed protein product [Lathyrus sativus]|nr:unnamed protein product [Lathyrus sativus]